MEDCNCDNKVKTRKKCIFTLHINKFFVNFCFTVALNCSQYPLTNLKTGTLLENLTKAHSTFQSCDSVSLILPSKFRNLPFLTAQSLLCIFFFFKTWCDSVDTRVLNTGSTKILD